jgi:hypothetical protein
VGNALAQHDELDQLSFQVSFTRQPLHSIRRLFPFHSRIHVLQRPPGSKRTTLICRIAKIAKIDLKAFRTAR